MKRFGVWAVIAGSMIGGCRKNEVTSTEQVDAARVETESSSRLPTPGLSSTAIAPAETEEVLDAAAFGKCALPYEKTISSLEEVSEAVLISLVVPSVEAKTSTAKVRRWVPAAKEHQGAHAFGVKTCAGDTAFVRWDPDRAGDAPTKVSIQLRVPTKDGLLLWIETGNMNDFCAAGAGVLALVTHDGKELHAITTPVELSCPQKPKALRIQKLGEEKLVILDDAFGSEHGGEAIFRAFLIDAPKLTEAGRWSGDGAYGDELRGEYEPPKKTKVLTRFVGDEIQLRSVERTWTCAQNGDAGSCSENKPPKTVRKTLKLVDKKLAEVSSDAGAARRVH